MPQLFFFCAGITLFSACASVPKGRYGITNFELSGVQQMDAKSLQACLATQERSSFSFNLGAVPEPECNVPPFDTDRVTLSLWRWPWTDWPVFERTIFERDLERIVRWYRARGFYRARILNSEVLPNSALDSDRTLLMEGQKLRLGEEESEKHATVKVQVYEGEPVIVRSLELNEDTELEIDLRRRLHKQIGRMIGQRFDEAEYDLNKKHCFESYKTLPMPMLKLRAALKSIRAN
ncbi:MAG: hypothetical protein IPJ88_15805 [Myxococcales bacterium]|nr:MAG: hypothetical protein IPJ88_15805 [Myxococcales bacterium]